MRSTQIQLPRVSRRVGIGVVAAAVLGAGIAWGVGPTSATSKPAAAGPAAMPAAAATATVSFTGDGASPSTTTLQYGGRVVFSNDVDPNQNVPVLGTVSGAVKTVTVTVAGATQAPFTLAPGQTATVGPYLSAATPLVIHFRATYKSTMVAGLVPGSSAAKSGTITVLPSPFTRPRLPGGTRG